MPDRQNVDGESQFWVHSLDSAWNVKVRTIAVKDGSHQDLVVAWDRGQQPNYLPSIQNLSMVGEMMAQSIIGWNTQSRVEMVGLSLGGQVVGVAGREGRRWKVAGRVINIDKETSSLWPSRRTILATRSSRSRSR